MGFLERLIFGGWLVMFGHRIMDIWRDFILGSDIFWCKVLCPQLISASIPARIVSFLINVRRQFSGNTADMTSEWKLGISKWEKGQIAMQIPDHFNFCRRAN